MKLLATLFIFFFSTGIMLSQTTKIIKLKYNSKKKKIEFVNKHDNEVIKGDEYTIVLTGINSTIISPKVDLKYFNISSDIPEILKPLLPSISSTSDLNKVNITFEPLSNKGTLTDEDALKGLYKNVSEKVNRLEKLRKTVDAFYKKTIYKTDLTGATDLKNEISVEFDSIKEKEKLLIAVTTDIFYIKAVAQAFKIYLEKNSKPTLEITLLYSSLLQVENTISKNDYLKSVNFMYAFTKAKNKVKLKSFKAKKGGLDVTINLMNAYTKDTIKTQTIDFYTKKNWNFDFTSGFFYSNKVDQGYFIEKRDSLINNIKKEKNRIGDVSIGALLHFSYKFTSGFKAGFNIGASLSPFDEKTRYLVGVSTIFGKNSKIAINSGLSFTKIKELSKAVKNDDLGNYVPATTTAVPTFERIQMGFYLALTYNIAAKKKYKD